jgi:low temperature requirement protein LtrA
LIIAASAFDGVAQGAIWALALAIDYGGPAVTGPGGWRVFPHHFAERHGLIVIIALGESVVAIGAGGSALDLTAGTVTAATLAIVAVACLWWTYFDVVAIVAERRLSELQGEVRNALARDSYSYLHLPMIAGIVLLALGIKKTLPDIDEPLKLIPAVALCGGVTLYMLAHVAFRLRNMGTLARRRLIVAILCLCVIPMATEADAIVALSAITSVLVALIVYEAIRFREGRARLRGA